MKPILVLLCLLLASSSALCQKMETLKIAIYDFRPHVFVDAGETVPTGAAIEFLTETLDIDGQYQIQWVVSPFSRFLADMKSGKADMGIFLAKTPDREQSFRYSDHSIFTTDSGIILPKDVAFTDLKSIKGQVLGHTQGSVEPDYFKGTEIKFDRLSGEDVIERNLRRLKLHRIDGVYVPTFSNGEFLLKKLSMEDQFKIVKIPNTSLELYFVFRKDIDAKTFTTINDLLNKHRTAYTALLEKFMSQQKTAAVKPGPK
ncbi:MAG: transporter substrate-binding domain-containing protein [Bdellovibrionales bacterium]|nr:transporter substrate-binding domain-containing protein [Bdellovibrionales bacterium]